MARVTVEDCLANVDNRFALVILAAERARQISKGSPALIECDNKPPVVSLREIAASKVRFKDAIRVSVERYLQDQRTRGQQSEE